MKRILKCFVAITLAIVMCFSIAPATTSEAASKKKITASSSEEGCKSVKTGTTTVKVTDSESCFYSFTAKKSGTYVITISKVKDTKDSDEYVTGSVRIGTMDNNYWFYTLNKYKTEGGKNNVFYLESRDTHSDSTRSKLNMCLTKRTIKVKMTKGETIMIRNFFYSGTGNKIQYKLNIKKK